MPTTRTGEQTSTQISQMGVITDLATENFSLDKGFLIKNDGAAEIILEVNLVGMKPGTYVTTIFETGWNTEIIREIKLNAAIGTYDLKWGY